METLLRIIPWWARVLALLSFGAACAAGASWKTYDWMRNRMDQQREDHLQFVADVAGKAEAQRLHSLYLEGRDRENQDTAQNLFTAQQYELDRALDGLRSNAGSSSRVLLPGPRPEPGIPAGYTLYDVEGLDRDIRASLGRFVERIKPGLRACGISLNEGAVIRLWDKERQGNK